MPPTPVTCRIRGAISALLLSFTATALFGASPPPAQGGLTPSPDDPGSIQAAIDAQPGRAVYLPPGVYRIDKPIRITTDASGLFGQGTIIQTNDDADIIQIQNADYVRIEGITLKREDPKFFKSARAIFADGSQFLTLKEVNIRGNRASPTAVLLTNCDYANVEGCVIIDFKTITIDNRMNNDLYRYAFRAIDGHGMMLRHCSGARIIRNRVIETLLRATEEIQKKYDLGKIVDRAPELGPLASYGVRDGVAFIWHQGGGIQLSGADKNAQTLVDGNYIENAAQAMDLHSDFMVITNNTATNCYTGVKVFHGSRGVIIANNIFHRPGKYGIMLRPGSESWEASEATADHPAREENREGQIIIANNVITDQGYDDEHWRLWNTDPSDTSPVGIKVGTGPLERNPQFTDIIITGNIIHDHGRDGVLVNGKPEKLPPRYKWAIWFDDEWRAKNVRMSGNLFDPGEKGVSNLPIEP